MFHFFNAISATLSISVPQNTDSFRITGQSETSISLQWNKVNNNSFILQYDGVNITIAASNASGPVNHTISNLTAGTRYTFIVYTVFENITSSGVNVSAVTGEGCFLTLSIDTQ